ncbi:copper chaperone CopZ [Flavobacterium sp. 103]|nr:copper chaperone CopZ [Flavobacterium sp. 103]
MIAILLLLSVVVSNAQIKNAKIESVKIYGNCGMCEAKIEKAGSLKNVANVDWNADTKMAVLSYDSKITSQDEILKRIALSGYDSDKFLAPDDTYSKLAGCCQYDREAKVPVKTEPKSEMTGMESNRLSTTAENQTVNQLQPVLDNYFLLKDALVKTDAKTASEKAAALLSSITAVKMEILKMDEHVIWMKILKDLTADSKSISETQDIKKQRDFFKSLSKNIYELIKVSKPTEAIYYQYCPMQDANWLSKENAVKNPYYGSQMLSCGKTIETIKY